MRAKISLAAFALTVTIATVALAAPRPSMPLSKSVGSPDSGRLIGGAELRGSRCVREVGTYRWGLPDLVGLVERSCKRVSEHHDGAVLSVGDLSKRGGGPIPGHHSHESGRDVDVGFYLLGPKNRQVFAPRIFAKVDEHGRTRAVSGARFDDAANWDLVQSLATDRSTPVLQIFIANILRQRLLEYAARTGASPRVRDRAASLMLQPHHALPHDDHFHVRIGCPRSSPECVTFATKRATHRQ